MKGRWMMDFLKALLGALGMVAFGICIILGFLWIDRVSWETGIARQVVEQHAIGDKPLDAYTDFWKELDRRVDRQKRDLDEIEKNLDGASVALDKLNKELDKSIAELTKDIKDLQAPSGDPVEDDLRMIGIRRVEPAFWGVITNSPSGEVFYFINGVVVDKECYDGILGQAERVKK